MFDRRYHIPQQLGELNPQLLEKNRPLRIICLYNEGISIFYEIYESQLPAEITENLRDLVARPQPPPFKRYLELACSPDE